MKTREIKETVERVVRTEYVAEDGTVFWDKAECEKYEQSALFVVSKNLVKLATATEYDLFNGADDNTVEIFDIKDSKDLDNLKKYIYLTAQKNGASQRMLEETLGFMDKFTHGHEIIIVWSYDDEYCWAFGNGSLQGYFDSITARYNKILNRDEK